MNINKYLPVIGIFFALWLGLGILIYFDNISEGNANQSETTHKQEGENRFRLISSWFAGDNARYTFQTPPEEKNYAVDCIGCEAETGNLVIFAEFGCPNQVKDLFESNSNRGVEEKSIKVDVNGKKIGEKRLTISKSNEKIVASKTFWFENNEDFWAIRSPNPEVAKAFENSKEYQWVRNKVAEEKENYIPIQNANTERIKATKEKECNEK